MINGTELNKVIAEDVKARWKKLCTLRHALNKELSVGYDHKTLLMEWVAECDSRNGNVERASVLWKLLSDALIEAEFLPETESFQVGEELWCTVAVQGDGGFMHGVTIHHETILAERSTDDGKPNPMLLQKNLKVWTQDQVRSELTHALDATVRARLVLWLETGRLLTPAERLEVRAGTTR